MGGSARRADTNGSSSRGRMKKMALVFRWNVGTQGTLASAVGVRRLRVGTLVPGAIPTARASV
jgi:hypothetical protein